ncbi:hypothetical protein LPJ66_009976 [Kickxella alabastrina]|uniref:Uncharacterized protein n=1 Tax=Kickxella alabastrina TaxID=61397 RepID=A0ACC1I5D3_9FUNG|nr:hypothetical protein LPJ66_009976 [Kickxella alabastrina]
MSTLIRACSTRGLSRSKATSPTSPKDNSNHNPHPTSTKARRIEHLPAELFAMILKHASGIAQIDTHRNYLQHQAQHPSLPTMIQLIRHHRNPQITQVNQHWRRTILAEFHQYAIYDGASDQMLAAPEHLALVRCVLVSIADGSRAFRSVARGLFWLPLRVRRGVRCLGLCMGVGSPISMSEYGALAEAFPGLVRVFVELGGLGTKLRSVLPVLVGESSGAAVSAISLGAGAGLGAVGMARLVRHSAPALQYLALGRAEIADLCRLFWPLQKTTTGGSLFPRLKRLYFLLCPGSTARPIEHLAGALAPFPMLEELCYGVDFEHSPVDAEGQGQGQGELTAENRQVFSEQILQFPMPHLRILKTDAPPSMDYLMLRGHTLSALDYLSLVNYNEQPTNTALSHMLNAAARSAHSLKHLGCWAINIPPPHYTALNLSFPPHPTLQVLDLKTWNISLLDLNNLLSHLPNLQEIKITLTRPQDHIAHDRIALNLELRRVWIGAVESKESGVWDSAALESLVEVVTRMLNLRELLVFTRAFEKLRTCILRGRSEDIFNFAKTVNIGICHCHEELVKRTTYMCL